MNAPVKPSPSRLATLALVATLALSACGGESAPALIASGKAFLAQREPAKAVIQLKAALQKEPQSAEGRYLLGKALLDAGDPAGAALELNKALDQQFENNLVMPTLARATLLNGGAKKLTSLYGQVQLSDKAANASFQASMANAWGVLGDRPKAMSALEAAAASQPDHPAVMVLQARVKASEGQYDAALAAMDAVLAKDPAYHEAWHFKGELLSHAKNDLQGGNTAFQKALEFEPASIASHLALINNHIRGNDIAAAKAQNVKLRAALPKHPQVLYCDAQLALLENDYKRAREASQQLLRIAPDNVGVLQLAGAVEAASGSAVLAEVHFGKALQIDPTLTLARRSLAKVYLKLGQPVKALGALQPILNNSKADIDAFGLAGEAQLQLGDARAAELLFLRAAKVDPKDAKPRTALALMRLSRGDAEAAFSQLEEISTTTSDTTADMALFSARLKRKDFEAAMKALDGLDKKQPKSARNAELRGLVHLAKKDISSARKAYETALTLEPLRFSAIARLADLDVQEGHLDQAGKRLDAAIAADARNHTARLALASLRLKQNAPLTEVKELLAAGITAAPSEPQPRVRLIDLLLQKKQFKDALTIAQEALASLPNDADVIDALGRAQVLAGDTQQAISTFRKLASVDAKNTRPHIRLAELLKTTGNKEGAVSSLRRALEIDPADEMAQSMLMDILSSDGRTKEALAVARDMQTRTPAVASGYVLEGAVHKRANNLAGAITAYQAGLKAATAKSELAVALHAALLTDKRAAEAEKFGAAWLKDNPTDLLFEHHFASVLLLRGEYAKAEALLQHVVTQRPNQVTALNNLAWVLTAQGKPGAVAHAQRANDLSPNRPTLMDTLALALTGEKQFPKALEVQRKAIEVAPGDMGLRLGLAKIAIVAGDKALAKTELDKLATMGTKLPFHAEVLRLLKTL